jgi:hypothetical protein
MGAGFEIKIKIKGFGLTASGFAFGELLLKSTKSNQKCLLSVWPSFVGFPHFDDAPWARAERTSMSWRRSRGIHAARPTARRLRSACTQVAIGGEWDGCV